MKKILFILFLAINILFIAQNAFAENFYIKNYDVEYTVTQKKAVYAKESIDTYFTTPSHGIYRKISINYGDKIHRVWASGKYDTTFYNDSATIKIGNPNKLISGDKHYNIEYDYQIGDKEQEFYFNIIGTEWDTEIQNASFKIIMPADVDPQKVDLSIGTYGTRGFKDIAEYNVNGNIITGRMLKTLPPKNGITIMVKVPDGYFTLPEKSFFEKFGHILVPLAMILFTLIAVGMWYIYGKDKHITPIVNFYPPQGLNSAQVRLIFKEKTDEKAIISLIFYLASKGYLKIEDNGKHFKITKLKDYDGTNEMESELMQVLFRAKNRLMQQINIPILDAFTDIEKSSDRNTVTDSELKYSTTFYQDIKNLVNNLKKYKKEIFTAESLSLWKNAVMLISMVGVIISLLLIMAGYSFDRIINDGQVFLLLFPVIGTLVFVNIFPRAAIFEKIYILVWASLFVGGPLFMLLGSSIITPEKAPLEILAAICTIIISICWLNLPRWKEDARMTKGQILGFKQFLQVAEKQRIEALSAENPNYCYDLIPFSYVLDVSDIWLKKLESMMVASPVWYSGTFSAHRFSHISRSLYNSSQPSSSNGGRTSSSGGGGFSGGGHGGGGGGSW